MSDLHKQSEEWDAALRSCPTMYCGRLDMATWNAENLIPQKMVYFDGEDGRVVCEGRRADFVAYAANRYQPLLDEVQRLLQVCDELTRQRDQRQLRVNSAEAERDAAKHLNKRALAIIADAIVHGMPVTREVAAVRNAILEVLSDD